MRAHQSISLTPPSRQWCAWRFLNGEMSPQRQIIGLFRAGICNPCGDFISSGRPMRAVNGKREVISSSHPEPAMAKLSPEMRGNCGRGLERRILRGNANATGEPEAQ